MKKLTFVLAVGALTLASCSKEKDCECSLNYNSALIDNTIVEVHIEEGECSDLEGNYGSTSMYGVSVNCVEK